MNYLWACLSAGLFAWAAPPFDVHLLALCAFVPVFHRFDALGRRESACFGWVLGFLLFVLVTPWWPELLTSYFRVGSATAACLWLAICAYQGLTYGIWLLLAKILAKQFRWHRLVVLPVAVALAEHLLPFPFKAYLAIGVWKAWPLTQLAEFGGPAAVSGFVVLINGVVGELLSITKRGSFRALYLGATTVGLLLCLNLARFYHIRSIWTAAPVTRLGAVASGFTELTDDRRQRLASRIVLGLREETRKLVRDEPDLVVWPETLWPHVFDRDKTMDFPVGHPWRVLVEPDSSGILFGALTHRFGDSRVFNSVVLVDRDGSVVGMTDKRQRIPFAEFDALPHLLPTERYVSETPMIAVGNASMTRDFAAFLCSEDLDVGLVRASINVGTEYLITVANHSWFPDRSAALQHLALSHFRAIENRKDLIRTANNGVISVSRAHGLVEVHYPPARGEFFSALLEVRRLAR